MPLFHRCWSQVGKRGGKQQLSLGSGCENKGRAIHELMHALGFLHEQSRQDRDEHVIILYQNIQDGECTFDSTVKLSSSDNIHPLSLRQAKTCVNKCAKLKFGLHSPLCLVFLFSRDPERVLDL